MCLYHNKYYPIDNIILPSIVAKLLVVHVGFLPLLLTPATAKLAPDQVQWTEQMQQTFVSLRNSLCDHVIPCKSECFVLCTEASGKCVGGVLYVQRKDELLPMGSSVAGI